MRVPHGGLDTREARRRGLDPEAVLDFSASLNPFGCSPRVLEALRSLTAREVGRYPDPGAPVLAAALAGRLGISAEGILVGAGSTELIRLLALAWLRPGTPFLGLRPDYGEYEAAAAIAGARIERLAPGEGLAPDLPALDRRLARRRPPLQFLGRPHNPTGRVLPARVVQDLAAAHPGTVFVLDEAYRDFVPEMEPVEAPNLLHLRSLTKAHGLAGLRLGYLWGPPALVARVREVAPPWSVGVAAERAGLAALDDPGHVEGALRALERARPLLESGLRDLGYRPLPSQANFLLVPTGRAADLRELLLGRGLLVRDGTSFGLPGHVRLSLRPAEDCRRLLEAMPRREEWSR